MCPRIANRHRNNTRSMPNLLRVTLLVLRLLWGCSRIRRTWMTIVMCLWVSYFRQCWFWRIRVLRLWRKILIRSRAVPPVRPIWIITILSRRRNLYAFCAIGPLLWIKSITQVSSLTCNYSPQSTRLWHLLRKSKFYCSFYQKEPLE